MRPVMGKKLDLMGNGWISAKAGRALLLRPQRSVDAEVMDLQAIDTDCCGDSCLHAARSVQAARLIATPVWLVQLMGFCHYFPPASGLLAGQENDNVSPLQAVP